MMKDKEIIDKLTDDTKKKVIIWDKSRNTDYSHSNTLVKWKGEKEITPNKSLAFILNYYAYESAECELKIFLMNNNDKTKLLIHTIDTPGIFDFKIKKSMVELVSSIEFQKRMQIRKQIRTVIDTPDTEYMGPIKSAWDREDVY